MPECLNIIAGAKLSRLAKLSDNTPNWEKRLGLLASEGFLCIMHDDNDPPDKLYVIMLDHPHCFKSFSGDISVKDSEVSLITKDTGYVFSITDTEMTAEKEDSLRSQLGLILSELGGMTS